MISSLTEAQLDREPLLALYQEYLTHQMLHVS
jgi:hypothetical protein